VGAGNRIGPFEHSRTDIWCAGIQQSLLAILETTSPRAWAFALIVIYEYLKRFAGDRRVTQVQEELAGRLLVLYQTTMWMDGTGSRIS